MKIKLFAVLTLIPICLAAQTPIFYAKIEEGTGTTTDDEIGPYTGTLTNMTEGDWVAGRNDIGFGLDFDGTDDVINFGDNAGLNDATFTITAWIYPRGFGEGGFGRIIAQDGVNIFVDNTTASNSFSIQIAGLANSGANDLTLDAWQHIAISCNGSNATFYKNGSSVGSPSFTEPAEDEGGNLLIGNRSANDRTFNGVIDELAIYSTALSGTEIADIYNSTATAGTMRKKRKPLWWGMLERFFYAYSD